MILFGNSWCQFCERTRRLLAEQGTPFVDIDVEGSSEARELLQSMGFRGVPVLIVGDRVISGFRPTAINEALAAAKSP